MKVQTEFKKLFNEAGLCQTEEEAILLCWNKRNKNNKAIAVKKEACKECGNETYVIYLKNGDVKSYCETCKDNAEREKMLKEYERKIMHYIRMSRVPKSIKGATFDNYKTNIPTREKAKKAVKDWIENSFSMNIGTNLCLHGTRGGGKSHLAIACINYLLTRKGNRVSCLFMSQNKLIDLVKSTWNKNANQTQAEVLERINDVDVLVIDDFADMNNTSDTDLNILTSIINERSGKPLIITTNLSPQAFKNNPVYKTLYSKVNENATVINIETEDYRQRNTKLINITESNIGKATDYKQTENDPTSYDLNNPPF